jgi:hypothetical protein
MENRRVHQACGDEAMTRDEIIKMARKAGSLIEIAQEKDLLWLTAFAKLVAEHERNEIIEILDASTGYVHMDAIRERGQA